MYIIRLAVIFSHRTVDTILDVYQEMHAGTKGEISFGNMGGELTYLRLLLLVKEHRPLTSILHPTLSWAILSSSFQL